jgi:pimeloyl-ACP methyl ester carboxylesterase
MLILPVALFVGLIVLLHGVSFLFALHDRSMKPYPVKFLNTPDGYRVRYYETKQPDALWDLVFIHGTPATAAVFGEQFHKPFPRANLYAADRPGFGGSDGDSRVPTLEAHVDALTPLFGMAPARRTILIGHSYGGPVALLAALQHPDKIAGVVLVGGSVDPDLEVIYAAQHVADWPVFSWLVPRSLRQCNRELITLRSDLIRLKAELPRLTAPVLMLHGAKDKQVPISNVDYLRAQLASAGKSSLFHDLLFPAYNHFIPWEHPDAMSEAIQTLIQALPPVREPESLTDRRP